MKNSTFLVLGLFLALSGVTLAQQAGEQKKGSSMMESMPDMMKGKQSGEGGMHGMGGMMGMMKMMEQCNEMMKSMPMQHQTEKGEETQKK